MICRPASINSPSYRQAIRDLRYTAPPSEVRVYDQQHKLLRIEQPTFWGNGHKKRRAVNYQEVDND